MCYLYVYMIHIKKTIIYRHSLSKNRTITDGIKYFRLLCIMFLYTFKF